MTAWVSNRRSHTARHSTSTALFQIGERIQHPTFGEGVVEARPDPGKMTVFFKSGRKVLVQAKEPPPPPVVKARGRRR